MNILQYFPTETGHQPRESQIKALSAIQHGLENGTKMFMLDAPVGCGKSHIAATIARYFGSAWVLTPKLTLQRQYQDTFGDVRLLRGRRWFPCTFDDYETNQYVVPLIKQGKHFNVNEGASCAGAKCTKKPASKRSKIIAECEKTGPCPYSTAVDVASLSQTVVSNYHAYCAQTLYNPQMFAHRKVMIIDEAHTLHSFLKDYLTTGFTIYRMVAPAEVTHLTTFDQWLSWLNRSEQLATFDTEESRDAYKVRLEKLQQIGEGVFGSPPITKMSHDPDKESFKIEFIPANVGGAARNLIYDFADVVVLLSGTWYGKDVSCREIGVDPALCNYIKVDSDFPPENRVVLLPTDQTLDMSHKHWEANLPRLAKQIRVIMDNHKGQRGLCHVNSYSKAWQLAKEIKSSRVIVHVSEDFNEKFKEFCNRPDGVLVSPSCIEGVDLKDDLCRFNILTTLPYPSAAEGWYQRLLSKGGWNVYNVHTMRQVGQALGRGVRHNKDHCVNYLLDSRFGPFLHKMSSVLPQWFKDALRSNAN